MDQTDRRFIPAVPQRDGPGRRLPGLGPSLLARVASGGPVALVLAGLATTAIWAGFLGWCVFSVVRWAVG